MERKVRRVIGEIAETQHGVVARYQGRVRGLSRGQMDHAVASGALLPVAAGVYRIPGAPQSLTMATMAATLASTGRASHSSSARLLRLDAPLPEVPLHVRVDVTHEHPRLDRVDVADAQRTFFGVIVHRCHPIDEPVVGIDGIPSSDAARTLIEIAPMLDAVDLADAFDRARALGLVSVDSLAKRFELLGGRGRPGTPKIRALLEQAAPRPLQSRLERLAERLITGSKLPPPVRQVRLPNHVGRYRLDFAWPELLATFETEGFEWHGTRARWKQDRIRVAAIERAGWRHMVGTWDDITMRPGVTLERISLMLTERRVLAAAGALLSSDVR